MRYEVVPCMKGFLAITASKWRADAGEIGVDNPFTLEPSMRVVDCFGNIVHIKEVILPKTRIPGQVPQYCYTVEESGNTYKYNEISGEMLALVSEENFKKYINENFFLDVL